MTTTQKKVQTTTELADACQFLEDFGDFAIAFNVEAGEDGGREYPSTEEGVSDCYISVMEGDWQCFCEVSSALHEKLMEAAGNSWDGEP